MLKLFALFLFFLVGAHAADQENEIVIEDSFFTRALSEEKKANLEQLMRESPFAGMSQEETKAFIQAGINNPILRPYLKDDSRFLNFLAEFLTDEKALPSFVKIINNAQALKTFGIIALLMTVLGFFYNAFANKGHALKRFFKKLLVSISILGINLAVFWFLFRLELAPTLEIIKKYI